MLGKVGKGVLRGGRRGDAGESAGGTRKGVHSKLSSCIKLCSNRPPFALGTNLMVLLSSLPATARCCLLPVVARCRPLSPLLPAAVACRRRC